MVNQNCHVWMCVCVYVCMYVCVCMYVFIHACMHACMDVWMRGCMDACMYGCMYSICACTGTTDHQNPYNYTQYTPDTHTCHTYVINQSSKKNKTVTWASRRGKFHHSEIFPAVAPYTCESHPAVCISVKRGLLYQNRPTMAVKRDLLIKHDQPTNTSACPVCGMCQKRPRHVAKETCNTHVHTCTCVCVCVCVRPSVRPPVARRATRAWSWARCEHTQTHTHTHTHTQELYLENITGKNGVFDLHWQSCRIGVVDLEGDR